MQLSAKTAQASACKRPAALMGARAPFAAGTKRSVACSAGPQASRRAVLELALAPAIASLMAPATALAAPKAPSGYTAVIDQQDNYQFLYPFGWQEVSVTGADVVFKDVVEPLESVSVTITPTDRKAISEFGSAEEVAETLATKVC